MGVRTQQAAAAAASTRQGLRARTFGGVVPPRGVPRRPVHLLLGHHLVDSEGPALDLDLVQLGDGLGNVLLPLHVDKGETLRHGHPRHLVKIVGIGGEGNGFDGGDPLEHLPDRVGRGGEGEVPHVHGVPDGGSLGLEGRGRRLLRLNVGARVGVAQGDPTGDRNERVPGDPTPGGHRKGVRRRRQDGGGDDRHEEDVAGGAAVEELHDI